MDIEEKLPLGALNNYVDKMRGEEGQKMSVFVNAQGIKTVHAGEEVKKGLNSVNVVVECPPAWADKEQLKIPIRYPHKKTP